MNRFASVVSIFAIRLDCNYPKPLKDTIEMGWVGLTLCLIILALGSASAHAQSPIAQYETLISFPEPNPNVFPVGEFPWGDVVEIKSGIFVGTTSAGAVQASGPCSATGLLGGSQGCGTLYQIDTTTAPPTFTLLWAFSGQPCGLFPGCLDGAVPKGTIAFDRIKYIYGTTSWSDSTGCVEVTPKNCGTIYRFDLSTGSMKTLWVMDPTKPGPQYANNGVLLGRNGHLYGVTDGSDKTEGTIFEYADPVHVVPGTAPNVYYVDNGVVGTGPQIPIEYSDGNLYGVAQNGMLFQFNTAAPASPVACGQPTGIFNGVGRLAVGADGNFYGVVPTNPLETFQASLTSPTCASPANFNSFNSGENTLGSPQAGLLSDSFGRLFGTIRTNGTGGFVYSFAPTPPSGLFGLYPGAPGSSGSLAELTEGSDGWIYGTNFMGPPNPDGSHPGSIFRFYVPPTLNSTVANQFGTLDVWDSASAIAVDARPMVLSSPDPSCPGPPGTHCPPGPRSYVAGTSNSNLAGIYGGTGSGGFFIARFFQDGTLDKSFAATNNTNDNGGFIQFGPVSGNPKAGVGSVVTMALDKDGNMLLAGNAAGNFSTFPCASNPGGTYIWVAKFTSEGFNTWCQAFGSGKADVASGLALDKSGNAYVAGYTDGSLPGNTLHGSTDAFIAEVGGAKGTPGTISEFAWKGQNVSSPSGISYCGGHLYVPLNAGTDFNVGDTSGWVAEFTATNFGLGPIADQAITSTNPTEWGAGVVVTDAKCRVYLSVGFFDTFGGIAQEQLGLQKYDKALKGKVWENDFAFQSTPASIPLLPESITSLVIDGLGTIRAAGSTNFSMFGRALPSNCAFGELPLISCAGWLAAFNSQTGAAYTRSTIEFGDLQTGLSQIAVDIYGNQHAAGQTVGAVEIGGETEITTPDGYVMDFLPAAICDATVPMVPCLHAPTAVDLVSASCGGHVLPGAKAMFTVTIKNNGVLEKQGSVSLIDNNSGSPAAFPLLASRPNATGTVNISVPLPAGTNNIVAVFSGKTTASGGNTVVDNPNTSPRICTVMVP